MDKIQDSKFYINRKTQALPKQPPVPFRSKAAQSDVLDIRSRGKYPANVLSNFSKTNFTFDGVKVNSVEGFLQSLKVKDPSLQEKFCLLDGFEAKKASKSIKRAKEDMLLFWEGKTFRKDSNEYKELLKKVVALQELSPNAPFEFAGMKVSCVNSFLLALKVKDPAKQKELLALPLDKVKEAAKSVIPVYDSRILYWKGKPIERSSKEYSKILERLYFTRFEKDPEFRNAIRLSKHFHLTHSIGKHNAAETVLTEKEFISLLEKLQSKDNYIYKIKDLFTNAALKRFLHK